MLLHVRPHRLNRIQFRRVWREVHHRQSRFSCNEGAQRLRLVNAGVIEQYRDRSRNVTQQMRQKRQDVCAVDRCWMRVLQKLSRRGDRSNRRHAVPAVLGYQHGRLTTGGPGAGHGGLQAEAHLIDEDECFSGLNFFFPTRAPWCPPS